MPVAKNYKIIVSEQTLVKINSYLEEIKANQINVGGNLFKQIQAAAAYFNQDINTFLSRLDLETFTDLLINTKVPKSFAENAVQSADGSQIDDGQGNQWTPHEVSLLDEIGFAVPVTIFDDGGHAGSQKQHQNPFTGELLFIPGPQLNNQANGAEILDSYKRIIKNGVFQEAEFIEIMKARLLPLFMHANNSSSLENPAFVTIPGISCGFFGGNFGNNGLKQIPKALAKAVEQLLEETQEWLPNIAGVHLDTFKKGSLEATVEASIGGRIQLNCIEGESVNNGRQQLDHPAQFGFPNCKLFSFVAADALSWPGNDMNAGSRATDEGVKTGATNAMSVMTGLDGEYLSSKGKGEYNLGAETVQQIVQQTGLRIETRGKILFLGIDGQFTPLQSQTTQEMAGSDEQQKLAKLQQLQRLITSQPDENGWRVINNLSENHLGITSIAIGENGNGLSFTTQNNKIYEASRLTSQELDSVLASFQQAFGLPLPRTNPPTLESQQKAFANFVVSNQQYFPTTKNGEFLISQVNANLQLATGKKEGDVSFSIDGGKNWASIYALTFQDLSDLSKDVETALIPLLKLEQIRQSINPAIINYIDKQNSVDPTQDQLKQLNQFVAGVKTQESNLYPDTPYRGVGLDVDFTDNGLLINEVFSPEIGRFNFPNNDSILLVGTTITHVVIGNQWREIMGNPKLSDEAIAKAFHAEGVVTFSTQDNEGVRHTVTCDNRYNASSIFAPNPTQDSKIPKVSALAEMIHYRPDAAQISIDSAIARGVTLETQQQAQQQRQVAPTMTNTSTTNPRANNGQNNYQSEPQQQRQQQQSGAGVATNTLLPREQLTVPLTMTAPQPRRQEQRPPSPKPNAQTAEQRFRNPRQTNNNTTQFMDL